jgi:ribonuclease P protein component
MGEANLSTQEPEAHADARLPSPDVDPSRPGGYQGPTPEGPSPADGLTWRIQDRATFRALASRPRHRRGPITLTSVASDDGHPPRVAYGVGRRVGTAVTRNRLRRRLRAVVAAHRSDLRPGTAYLFGAGPEATGASPAELEAAVADLIRRADTP